MPSVLDASAAVEIVLNTDIGADLAQHLYGVDEFIVPDHFHLEAIGVIRRMEANRKLSSDEAQRAHELLLELRVLRVDTRPLLSEAWSMRHNLTIADALYVVVARRLGIPLVTGDVKLARAPGLGIDVLGPSSTVPPPRA